MRCALSRQAWIWPALLLAGCARFESRPLEPAQTALAFQARSLAGPDLRRFLEANLGRACEPWPRVRWDLETLQWVALYYHPSLDVARAEWDVAAGGIRTAAARLNPTLGVVPGYDVNSPAGLTPWFPQVTFDLPIETAGKRGFRQAQARHLSEAARFQVAVTAWQVRAHLRTSLLDWTAARRHEDLLNRQQALRERIVGLLEQQAQAGALARSEVSVARIALYKDRLEWADARQQAAEARVRLADALGVSVAALEGLEFTCELEAPPPGEAEWTSLGARQAALLGRADVLGALAEYAASQSALQLEVAKQYPDIHLGPGYQYDQGDHKISLSLTAELPLLNQNQGPIAEAMAHRAAAAARFVALQAKVAAEIDRGLAGYLVAKSNAAAADTLVAAQTQRAAEVESQWKAGAATRLDLLQAQLEALAGERIRWNGRVKWWQAAGALEDALQRPLAAMSPRLYEAPQRPSPTAENKL